MQRTKYFTGKIEEKEPNQYVWTELLKEEKSIINNINFILQLEDIINHCKKSLT